MTEYKQGDIIVAIEPFLCSNGYPIGSTGTLLYPDGSYCWAIKMDLDGRNCYPNKRKFKLYHHSRTSTKRRTGKSTRLSVTEEIKIVS